LELRKNHHFVDFETIDPELPQMLKNSTFEIAPTVLYLLAKPSVSDETREVAVDRKRTPHCHPMTV